MCMETVYFIDKNAEIDHQSGLGYQILNLKIKILKLEIYIFFGNFREKNQHFELQNFDFGVQNLVAETTLVIDFDIFIDEIDRFHAHRSSRDTLGWFRNKNIENDFS